VPWVKSRKLATGIVCWIGDIGSNSSGGEGRSGRIA
jgi:hypothetical protein